MARVSANSLDEIIRDAVGPVVAKLAGAIAKHVAELTAKQLEAELARGAVRRGRTVTATRSRPRNVEMTKWVADNRARRVPNFVIELTGLKTKKQIVARYGADAAFEKGKPLPPEAKGAAEPKREVKAKPPTIRKNGKAAA